MIFKKHRVQVVDILPPKLLRMTTSEGLGGITSSKSKRLDYRPQEKGYRFF